MDKESKECVFFLLPPLDDKEPEPAQVCLAQPHCFQSIMVLFCHHWHALTYLYNQATVTSHTCESQLQYHHHNKNTLAEGFLTGTHTDTKPFILRSEASPLARCTEIIYSTSFPLFSHFRFPSFGMSAPITLPTNAVFLVLARTLTIKHSYRISPSGATFPWGQSQRHPHRLARLIRRWFLRELRLQVCQHLCGDQYNDTVEGITCFLETQTPGPGGQRRYQIMPSSDFKLPSSSGDAYIQFLKLRGINSSAILSNKMMRRFAKQAFGTRLNALLLEQFDEMQTYLRCHLSEKTYQRFDILNLGLKFEAVMWVRKQNSGPHRMDSRFVGGARILTADDEYIDPAGPAFLDQCRRISCVSPSLFTSGLF